MFLFLVEAFRISRWKLVKILVKSFGCSTNRADGSTLAGCLATAGHEIVDSARDADLVIFNTCAVKGPTESRAIDACKRVRGDKKLIVAGCLPLVNFERLRKHVWFDAVVGPAAGEYIVELVERVGKGERIVALQHSLDFKPPLSLPRIEANRVVSVVPVCYGCLGSCSYCCVVFARGRLRSYPVQEIVERVRADVNVGFREFWLTAQDMGCYGKDIQTDLAQLLDEICKVQEDFRVRVGMMTPNRIIDILDKLVEIYANDKIFKFMHLPVQSGNENVLKQMHRLYSVNDFKAIVKKAKKSLPTLTLSTDVICGFPGEDGNAFEDTLNLIAEFKPDIVNVSKFFARPKTAAAKMKNVVPATEIKRRSGMATTLAKKISFERNKQWLGWKGKIVVDEIGKIPGSVVGRNFAYKPIAVDGTKDLLGKTLAVKVVKAFPTYLAGEVLQ
jgi:MiaB-like tRNA modifying enzyme